MQNNTENQVYAGFFVRLAAYIIDWIIVGCALLVVKFPLWIATVASPDNFIVKDFIFHIRSRILYYICSVCCILSCSLISQEQHWENVQCVCGLSAVSSAR